ncbi:MAG: DUF4424 family protein [Steroidobacteraceae bacterium]
MMMRTLHWTSRCAAWALLAAIAGTSRAAGSSTGAPLPGLTSDEGSKVAAESCWVTLSGENVSVELSVYSVSNQPALLIEGPLFGPQGESEAYPDRHFPELEVRIDGAPVTPEDRFEAFMGKSDITSAIRDAGMDPWAIARNPPVTPVRPDARALKALERMHAVQHSGEEYLANWTARRVLRIPFKASANQRIELRYRARPAFVELPSHQLLSDGREAAYCVSPTKANAMLHAGSSPRLVHVAVAEYSIATGIDGRPAATVLLTKSANAGSAAASRVFTFACGPHGKPIAVAGNLTRRPVQVDQAGNLRILEVTEP